MIAGLCESPLTFQAIIIWRDELNGDKVFLRDIIDLEATYVGPDAEATGAGDRARRPAERGGAGRRAGSRCARANPGAASCTRQRDPFKAAPEGANGENGETPPAKAISTTMIWSPRSRLPPSRPSSSPSG